MMIIICLFIILYDMYNHRGCRCNGVYGNAGLLSNGVFCIFLLFLLAGNHTADLLN